MEFLGTKARIIVDSTLRGFINTLAFGPLPDTGTSIASQHRSTITQEAMDSELKIRQSRLDLARKAGLDANSFAVYRTNL